MMAENPKTWTPAEHVIHETIAEHERIHREYPELCGFTLVHEIYNALVSRGFLSRILDEKEVV